MCVLSCVQACPAVLSCSAVPVCAAVLQKHMLSKRVLFMCAVCLCVIACVRPLSPPSCPGSGRHSWGLTQCGCSATRGPPEMGVCVWGGGVLVVWCVQCSVVRAVLKFATITLCQAQHTRTQCMTV